MKGPGRKRQWLSVKGREIIKVIATNTYFVFSVPALS